MHKSNVCIKTGRCLGPNVLRSTATAEMEDGRGLAAESARPAGKVVTVTDALGSAAQRRSQ